MTDDQYLLYLYVWLCPIFNDYISISIHFVFHLQQITPKATSFGNLKSILENDSGLKLIVTEINKIPARAYISFLRQIDIATQILNENKLIIALLPGRIILIVCWWVSALGSLGTRRGGEADHPRDTNGISRQNCC